MAANETDDSALGGCLVGLGCLGFLIGALLLYGVAVIIFRNAFGVELPNPFFWKQ
jgi:hypothetical protein